MSTIPVSATDKRKIQSQMLYVLLMPGMVVLLGFVTHDHTRTLVLGFLAMATGWMSSIFMFSAGPLPAWRIVLAVLIQGTLLYLMHLFVLPR